MNMEKLSVPIAIVIAGGIIGVSLYYANVKTNSQALVTNNQAATTNSAIENMKPVSADDHILGDPNADLVIVEYSDTECPFCKQFQTTMQQIMSVYGKDGKVAWVYRHFPIASLHSKAPKEAEALECANSLGGPAKFWEYENLIYQTTNSNNSLDPAELPAMAKQIGLNVTDFNSCLSSGKFAAVVQADYEDAIKAGGQGTPTSIIISKKDGSKTLVQGAQPYQNLKSIIDALLQG